MTVQVRTTRRIVVEPPAAGFSRADLVFEGVEQGGRSFEARVFLNNPGADEHTVRALESGYAGAFHVYGYGLPGVGVGTGGPLSPITKYLTATDAVRQALERAHWLDVTVVALPAVPGPHFRGAAVVFDRAP